ncbi:MAG: DMT family transporter [Candidatus Kariarchaeaceae archaeon]
MKFVFVLPLLSTSIWGVSIVGAKILSLDGFEANEIVFLRFMLASIIFLPVLLFNSSQNQKYRLNGETWKNIVLLAISGVALNNVIFYLGLERTDASIASLLVSFTPLTTMIFASILLSDNLTKRRVLSVGMGILGVYIILGFTDDHGKLFGNLLILFAITIWGSSFSFSRRASDAGLSSIAITGWSQIIGTLMVLPFGFNSHTYDLIISISLESFFWLLFLGIISSVFAYVIHYYAIAELGASKVAPSTNIIPLSGVVASWVFLNETIGLTVFLGAILIILAVILVQMEPTNRKDQFALERKKLLTFR